VQGDKGARVKLTPTLAPDEATIRAQLTEINKYDIELLKYAETLLAYRLKFIPATVLSVKEILHLDSHQNTVVAPAVYDEHAGMCKALDSHLDANTKKQWVGIFQPPGHKGPF
jgi:hypothetical protein